MGQIERRDLASSHAAGLEPGTNGTRGFDSAAKFQHEETGPIGSKQELRPPSIIADIQRYDYDVLTKHPEDVGIMMGWMREYSEHLYPLPDLPDFSSMDDLRNKSYELRDWFAGARTSEGKIIRPGVDSAAFRAIDANGKLIAVSNIVWRGMTFIPDEGRIAYRERNLIDPKYHGQRLAIGKTIAAYALEYAFHIATPYRGQNAAEIRAAEILTPDDDPNTAIKHGYFEAIGYVPHGKPKPLDPENPNTGYFQPYRLTKERYDEEIRPRLLPLVAKFLYSPQQAKDILAKL